MQLTLADYQIRLIDSLNFFQLPLSALPEAFGLDLSLHSKGDFPLKFNTVENQNYVGKLLSIEYYLPETKKPKAYEELLKWHQKISEDNYVFDFQKEMYKYCSQDVSILRLCCMTFRQLFLDETGVDPFTQCTIASACMSIYRSKYLKENTLATSYST